MKILPQMNLLTKRRTDYILKVTCLWILSGNTWQILQHYEIWQFSTIWLTAPEKELIGCSEYLIVDVSLHEKVFIKCWKSKSTSGLLSPDRICLGEGMCSASAIGVNFIIKVGRPLPYNRDRPLPEFAWFIVKPPEAKAVCLLKVQMVRKFAHFC